jgi:hypothetical protein
MNSGISNPTHREFLEKLLAMTQGETSRTVSMYEVGAGLGLDKREASTIAEDLMAMGWVEIRTLSGGIGFSEAGISEMAPGGSEIKAAPVISLGKGPVLDEAGRDAAEKTQSLVKEEMGALSLNFENLSELMADLRTIDVQLDSPKPKTAIIRECYRSIEAVLAKTASSKSRSQVAALIKDNH